MCFLLDNIPLPIYFQAAAMRERGQVDSSQWDKYRTKVDEMSDSEEDEEEREKRLMSNKKKGDMDAKVLKLPAGVDVGNYIEETLRRMPEPIIGPKQIDPELLRKDDKSTKKM